MIVRSQDKWIESKENEAGSKQDRLMVKYTPFISRIASSIQKQVGINRIDTTENSNLILGPITDPH